MKKVSTAAGNENQESFSTETDDRFGPGGPLQLLLRAGRGREDRPGKQSGHHSQSTDGQVCGHAAQPDRAGNRDALAVGEPAAERAGTRDHRGARTQRAPDRGEPEERRSAGCPDACAVGLPGLEIVLGGGRLVSRRVEDCDFTDTRDADCLSYTN
jgi:hypothetical protein